MASKSVSRRILFLSLVIFLLFSVLIAQFFRIQIVEGEHWSQIARRQHHFIVKEPFMRGKFLSNTSIKMGHPEKPQYFVFDVEKYHLYVDPMSIPEEYRDMIADRLLSLLDLSVNEQKGIREQFNKQSRSRKIAMWLENQDRLRVLEWWKPYASKRKIASNALFFVSDYQRSYPFGKLLGQVLHTIQGQKDTETQQAIPTGGLELSLNKYLRGTMGKRMLMRSPRHALETDKVIEPPQHGADVYLTVNHYLQEIAEEEIEAGVKRAKAKAGWAVMMDPRNGEILALAQYPFFNPPDYSDYFADSRLIDDTKVKAITDASEPGSIMKPLTLAIALDANRELTEKGERPLFDPAEKVPTANGVFPGRTKPIRDTRLHNYLNMNMALQKSSNIYMARLMQRAVERFGDRWYHDKLETLFGFGRKTGIELPGESRGVLPVPGRVVNGLLEWSKPTPYSISFGYNIQANTMQILRAYSVLANRGMMVEPTLVRKIVRNEEVLLDTSRRYPRRVTSPEVIEQVINAMKYSVSPGGTAKNGKIPGYTMVAKTGTARKIIDGQYVDNRHFASYVGFAPIENPQFVLIVCIDEPEVVLIPGLGNNLYGSVCAAPVFRSLARRSLEYLGVAPDDPDGYADTDKGYWVKESRILQEMYEKWNN